MNVRNREQICQAIACLTCTAVLWLRLDDYGASEFSGGWLTGPLFRMADIASLLFLLALPLTFWLRRIAGTIALAGTLLSLPFYMYILMPGPYNWIFNGESSMPILRPYYWNNWAVVAALSLLVTAILSIRSFFKVESHGDSHRRGQNLRSPRIR